jgi:hypothetical protein
MQAKRQARTEEHQQMQAMEQASQLAQGAKVLSDNDAEPQRCEEKSKTPALVDGRSV